MGDAECRQPSRRLPRPQRHHHLGEITQPSFHFHKTFAVSIELSRIVSMLLTLKIDLRLGYMLHFMNRVESAVFFSSSIPPFLCANETYELNSCGGR